jgi:hypothetical protein
VTRPVLEVDGSVEVVEAVRLVELEGAVVFALELEEPKGVAAAKSPKEPLAWVVEGPAECALAERVLWSEPWISRAVERDLDLSCTPTVAGKATLLDCCRTALGACDR